MARKRNSVDEHYSLLPILGTGAHYNLIFGERSNGKTYSVLSLIAETYARTGKQGAYLRRMREDFIGKRGAELFRPLVENGEIRKFTKGKWEDVYYYSGRWYMCRYDETPKGRTERITDETPFCYGFSIASMEHDKGTGYPNITTICFDEFITRNGYLRDEFVLFMNTLSTIIRRRNDVKIFMLGNTVNKYCPYFDEMGLRHIKDMKQGDIDVYTLNHDNGTALKIAVEYCKPSTKGKKSDFYFAFDNKRISMITNGIWEIDLYPHCPYRYRPKDILFTYFILFDRDILQCEIVMVDDVCFTFIHRKTTPLKDTDHDLIYSREHSARPNWARRITHPRNDLEKHVLKFFTDEKVFYQDNEVGEIVRNYLQWCKRG